MEHFYTWARSFISVSPEYAYLINFEHQLGGFLFNTAPANSVNHFSSNTKIAPQTHFFTNTAKLRFCTLKVTKEEFSIISSVVKYLVCKSKDLNVVTQRSAPFYSLESKQISLLNVSFLSSIWAWKVLELLMLSDRNLEEVKPIKKEGAE